MRRVCVAHLPLGDIVGFRSLATVVDFGSLHIAGGRVLVTLGVFHDELFIFLVCLLKLNC